MLMTNSDRFIENVLRIMAEQGMTEAELSRRAGLNARAITDLREAKAQSPKLSTALKIARALQVDIGELTGLPPRPKLKPELARFLSQYDEHEQEQILQALSALPLRHD